MKLLQIFIKKNKVITNRNQLNQIFEIFPLIKQSPQIVQGLTAHADGLNKLEKLI